MPVPEASRPGKRNVRKLTKSVRGRKPVIRSDINDVGNLLQSNRQQVKQKAMH